MKWYLLFYVLGIAAAILSPYNSIKESLEILAPITLTALFASLLVPFAGFAKNERWYKFVLQYALIPLFGMYTVVLWQKSSVVGIVLLVCASGVHAAYWMSSIHSRNYRLEQFRLGFAHRMPATAQIIAMLNGQGRSHQADILVSCVLNGEGLPGWGLIRGVHLAPGNSSLMSLVDEEMSKVTAPSPVAYC
jgi:hypothetical protein